MAQISVLKKFNINLIVLIIASLFSFISHSYGQTAPKNRLPVFKNLGIIPVQWQASDQSTSFRKVKSKIQEYWLKTPSESGRFQLLNVEVSSELWSSPQGRAELVQQYEIHGFLSLTATVKHDIISFTTRLLSPTLEETYLHEVETVPLSWLMSTVDKNIHDRLKDLLFRMLNRLPIDTIVTSVQGNFLTFSSGTYQNLKIGDELIVRRARIQDIHPATGAWLNFQSHKLGRVKIIDVGHNASVAQITSQSYEGAIKVGDGAKIPHIPSRIRFKRLANNMKFSHTEHSSPILYPPVKKPAPPKQVVKIPKDPPPTPVKTEEAPSSTEKIAVTQPSDFEEELDNDSNNKFLGLFDYLWAAAGLRLWNASGSNAVSVSSNLPVWLLNSFTMRLGQFMTEDIGWEALGNLDIGSTSKGSFIGFGAGARAFYRLRLHDNQGLGPDIDLGAMIKYQSLGVNGERYGGEDVLKIAPFLRYEEPIYISELEETLNLFAEFDYSPIALGQVGIRGSMHRVTTYQAWHVHIGGTLASQHPGDPEWGGLLMFGNESYEMSKHTLSISDLCLAAIVQIPF